MLTPKIKLARRSDSEFNANLSKRRTWYAEGDVGATTDTAADTTTQTSGTQTDTKPAPKFTQEDMDKVAGNRAKEAAAAAVKKLLKDLGIENPDDPKALETVKGKLTAAQQAEEAQLSATQKLERERDAAIKERDDAKAAHEKSVQDIRLKERDNAIAEALAADGVNCLKPKKVATLLKADHPSEVEALLNSDGSIDKDKLAKLLEVAKKEYQEDFRGKGAGTGSHGGGRGGDDTDKYAGERYSSANQQRIRG